jgi:hypothetical protein
MNSQTSAPIRLRFNSTHGHREDISQETPTPSSFESSHDFVTRRRAAFNNDGGNDDREHFLFPDPLSPVTERGTSSDVIGVEPTEPSSSGNTIIEAKLAAELRGGLQQSRAHKGKGIARGSTPSTNSQEPIFLPLLKEDSHFPRQPDCEKPRSSSFHSKLASLNTNRASATVSEAPRQSTRLRDAERYQKTVRHLRLQNLIQRDQIKNLRIQTKDFTEGLKQLQGSTTQDIRRLEEISDIQRESHNQLVGACEGMKRELLQLNIRMAQEQLGQRVVSRDRGGYDDEDRHGGNVHVPDRQLPPPHYPLQPTTMEYAVVGDPYPYPFFDPWNSNPRPTTSLESNESLGITTRGEPRDSIRNNGVSSWTSDPIANQSFSRTQPVSHGVDPDIAYNLVQPQYWDYHRESHILQNPQGCRWYSCPVCWSGGERGVWFE